MYRLDDDDIRRRISAWWTDSRLADRHIRLAPLILGPIAHRDLVHAHGHPSSSTSADRADTQDNLVWSCISRLARIIPVDRVGDDPDPGLFVSYLVPTAMARCEGVGESSRSWSSIWNVVSGGEQGGSARHTPGTVPEQSCGGVHGERFFLVGCIAGVCKCSVRDLGCAAPSGQLTSSCIRCETLPRRGRRPYASGSLANEQPDVLCRHPQYL